MQPEVVTGKNMSLRGEKLKIEGFLHYYGTFKMSDTHTWKRKAHGAGNLVTPRGEKLEIVFLHSLWGILGNLWGKCLTRTHANEVARRWSKYANKEIRGEKL